LVHLGRGLAVLRACSANLPLTAFSGVLNLAGALLLGLNKALVKLRFTFLLFLRLSSRLLRHCLLLGELALGLAIVLHLGLEVLNRLSLS